MLYAACARRAMIEPPEHPVPLADVCVRAGISGFPSPAQDHVGETLDLNRALIARPHATYLFTAEGDSMQSADGAGIYGGDLLLVDRAIEPRHGDTVIAVVDGELLVKTLQIQTATPGLYSANPRYAPIPLVDRDIQIWGVVTSLIRRMKR